MNLTSAPEDRLILALDFPSAKDALACVDRLEGRCRWVKIGLELYFAAGPGIVETLAARGLHVFLDLKLHDIPNTVAAAVRALSTSGASLLTVHALGGAAMLSHAAEAASLGSDGPKLLAVTVLTSMDQAQLHGIGMESSPALQVERLALLARTAGIDGLVCSPEEVAALSRGQPASSLLVVPGIRPAGSAADDQSRVATPAQAIAAGASMLVVGRPVTQAVDPALAFQHLLDEIASTQA